MHIINTACCLLLLTSYSLSANAQSLPVSASHIHINHLIKSWPDAPKSISLLATIIKEATIADLEIKLARVQDRDLVWIKAHINRAKHALKGKEGGEGGLNYGAIKAAFAIARHTKLAASDGASINVKLHSKTIINSAFNTASIAKKMARICNKIEKTTTTEQALTFVSQLEILSAQLFEGADLDKDGEISAYHKEGGLNLAKDQLTFMARAEGLIKKKL